MISTLTPCKPEPDKRVRLLICFTFPHFWMTDSGGWHICYHWLSLISLWFQKKLRILKISLNKKSEYKTVQKRHWHLRWFSFWPYLIKKKINYHLREIRNTWFIFFWINNLTLICQKYTNNVLDFQIFQIHKNKMKIRWAELPMMCTKYLFSALTGRQRYQICSEKDFSCFC